MSSEIPPFDQRGPNNFGDDDRWGHLLGLPLAPWWRRTVATAIDASVFLAYLVLNDWLRPTWWGFLAGFLLVGSVVTEFSPGKTAMRLTMAVPVMDRHKGPTLASPTYWLAYKRTMLKPLDLMFFGWARPLWHRHRQSWADSWTGVIFFVNERGPWNEDFIYTDPQARGRPLI